MDTGSGILVELAHAGLTLTAGGNDVLAVTEASGTFRFSAAGVTMADGSDTGTAVDTFSGTVALTVPGLTLTGGLELLVDTTSATPTVRVAGTTSP